MRCLQHHHLPSSSAFSVEELRTPSVSLDASVPEASSSEDIVLVVQQYFHPGSSNKLLNEIITVIILLISLSLNKMYIVAKCDKSEKNMHNSSYHLT